MREFIFPIVLSVVLMIAGVYIALQPVLDPGYVHPVALMTCGLVAAMLGAAFAVWALMAAAMDRRDAAWARDLAAR